jgi:acetyl/propionyl-CoA carboxylase alpha subunit
VLTTVLVANRGVIASRIFRTTRALGLASVAVFSDADSDLPYVGEADLAVRLPGTRAEATYLSVEALLAAAKLSGADAIHPGYGFLAENAEFATACAAAGLVFIGPSPQVIRAMGSKAGAKDLALGLDVPVLSSVTYRPEEPDSLAAIMDLPFPLLVKPSAGGGGKGMCRVDAPDQLMQALSSARRQAAAAFADDTLIVERYVTGGRHVEVQVVADQHGNLVHLGERECSVQRRHQKIIEESPSTAVDDKLRSRLAAAALRLAAGIEYRGVGTVEFLLAEDGSFWFLEMNTRLQVEHAVTEERTGLDLVELQLRVARGEPLPLSQADVQFTGHAVEARLYAESAEAGFLPSAGQLTDADFSRVTTARVESGVATGTVVSTLYDPMLAKLISWGPDRTTAVDRLGTALRQVRIAGVAVNRDFLCRLLDEPDFRLGRTTTSYVDEHPGLTEPNIDAASAGVLALAVLAADAAGARAGSPIMAWAPLGWRNVGRPGPQLRLDGPGGEYVVSGLEVSPGRWSLLMNGVARQALLTVAPGGLVDVETDRVRRRCVVHRDGQAWNVQAGGLTAQFTETSASEADLRAAQASDTFSPLPGTVTAVAVAAGDQVKAGALLVIVEAMKMEHRIHAVGDGLVEKVHVAVGSTVTARQLLVAMRGAELTAPARDESSADPTAPASDESS